MATSLLPALPTQWPQPKKTPMLNKLHSMYYKGLPVEQYYDLTLLKKSNVRSNDQLLPKPTECDMSKFKINREFPAEHPYSSHMSRFAVFPSFSSLPDDYVQRGEIAERQRPLHPHMPASPHAIRVVHQSKGGSDRWEKQELPLVTEAKPLRWPGDTFFQEIKSATSVHQQYYPTPMKAVLPNHVPRSCDRTINARTANALKNLERAQWVTTYDKNFTGYGPANALRLDNFAEKLEKEQKTGIMDHTLHPRSYNTFMPPRPLEGRVSRLIGSNQMVRCVIKDGRIQYVPYDPKIVIEMDKVREHPNLPSEACVSFRKHSEMAKCKPLQTQYTATHTEKQQATVATVDHQSLNEDTKHKEELKNFTEGRFNEADTAVTPWDFHKTAASLYQCAKEAESLADTKDEKIQTNIDEMETYQFAGHPGANPYITPKHTERHLHNMARASSAPSSGQQLPVSQSIYTPSFSPDKVRTVEPANGTHVLLTTSLPKLEDGKYSSRDNSRTLDPILKIRHSAEAKQEMTNDNTNTASVSSRPLYDPAYKNPDSNPVVDTRHSNPEGTNDFRFRWTPGYPHGNRPQTTLLKIQNSFSKSDVRKHFLGTFYEHNPDLRENIATGKKHDFHGENAYYWH